MTNNTIAMLETLLKSVPMTVTDRQRVNKLMNELLQAQPPQAAAEQQQQQTLAQQLHQQ